MQVARVEKEIRVAQREAMQMRGQVGKVGQTKRTFERETPVKETERVSSSGLPPEPLPHSSPYPHSAPALH